MEDNSADDLCGRSKPGTLNLQTGPRTSLGTKGAQKKAVGQPEPMAHRLENQKGRSSTAMPWRCVFESPSRKGGDLDLRLCDPSRPPEGASPAVHAAEVVVSGTQRANYRLTKLGHRQHEHDRGPALEPRQDHPPCDGRQGRDPTRAILATSPCPDKHGS